MSKPDKDDKEETKEPKYPCINCGFMTNGDFLCKCGEVLCESCSDNDCPECKEREERRYERRDRGYDYE